VRHPGQQFPGSGSGDLQTQQQGLTGTEVVGLLEKLDGHTGARKLIQQHSQDAGAVSFPLGGIDVDTPEDYQMLRDKLARGEK